MNNEMNVSSLDNTAVDAAPSPETEETCVSHEASATVEAEKTTEVCDAPESAPLVGSEAEETCQTIVQTDDEATAPAVVTEADNSLVVCSGLRRRFGDVNALDGINLVLSRGKIIGLLGPNGAGKTTLIKILNGLLRADEGVVTIDGHTPGVESKKIVSYLPDRMYFADWMKVGDMIDLFTDFYKDFDKDKSSEMCRVLGIERKQRIKSLSKGTCEKMQLMLVMSRKAKLYLLDEPIAGVDPAAREFILHTILSNYNEGGSVVLSTHLITDVQEVLDEAVFIQSGRVLLHDSVKNIRERENKSVDELFRDMFRMDYASWGGGR